ncbi:UTP--GlnB (protein PII) uridylyltransferase, GlnD [Formivibrio citricus]|uniref:Bifunctional uridylyltransferase/uridylyl-removing enzyme n=1 Tax=Formivibrio citricus TaxID=83765 RepID=A0A1I5BTB9_9NEIS|nr:[protein-PII] uridylyltransferase [Formivibrio citricus]SFN77893.1 UTP--GlnB (protein PII) uridylyltransferase, GlnD [Formivibrio citricus]
MRSTAEIRQDWTASRNALKSRYPDPRYASPVLHQLTALSDRILRELWSQHDFPQDLLLVAVGGYGRCEHYPFSDTDLLILLPDELPPPVLEKLEAFIGRLWDVGMDIGHSVRTLAECIDEAGKDVTVQTALLENHLLAGDPTRFAAFRDTVHRHLDPKEFFEAKLLEQQARYGKFQNAPYKLEPNIKEAPGGLRDLQLIGWITNSLGLGRSWRSLSSMGLLTQEEHRKLRQAERVLRCCRIQLHWRANRHEDRILFDYQNQLAADFGFSESDQGPLTLRASEALMAEYYLAARVVMQLTPLLLQALRTRIFSPLGVTVSPINERFQLRGDLLEITAPDVFEREPSAILEAFLLTERLAEASDIAPSTLRALWNARPLIDDTFREDPKNRQLFIDLFREPRGLTSTLRRMNQYGVLGRYIPEFGHIVGRMQHDLFHVYTVDEHTLMVLRNLRRFARPAFTHEYPLCSRLIAEFPHPEALYLAALFHDIGKGRGGDHSRIGAEIARKWCEEQPLPTKDRELIPWLVEHHLTMSQISQKEDIYDPETVARFAGLVGDQTRLCALYLLTVADIRGTSPKVWNAWKAKLLEDLFGATSRLLTSQNITHESWVEERLDEAKRLLQLYGFRPDAHEAFWNDLDTVYFLRHDAREIAWHTRTLFSRIQSDHPIVRARLSESGEVLQVLIYARDQPDLFARICIFFERAGFSIFDAKIHTTRRGYALDSFYVYASQRSESYRELISYVEYELAQRISAQATLPPPHKGRISRQLRHFPVAPHIAIRPDERNGKFHVLSVVAGDRPGLLSTIARVLSANCINLESAKIMTLGERAEDTFLISGKLLDDEKAVVQLETDLLQALQE